MRGGRSTGASYGASYGNTVATRPCGAVLLPEVLRRVASVVHDRQSAGSKEPPGCRESKCLLMFH